MTPDALAADAHLFAPRPAIRYRTLRGFEGAAGPGKNYQPVGTTTYTFRQITRPTGEKRQKLLDAGQNPPDGAVISYHLREKPAGEVTLTFLDARRQRDQDLPEQGGRRPASPRKRRMVQRRRSRCRRRRASIASSGTCATRTRAMSRARSIAPAASPGRSRLPAPIRCASRSADQSWTQPFEIRKDPRVDGERRRTARSVRLPAPDPRQTLRDERRDQADPNPAERDRRVGAASDSSRSAEAVASLAEAAKKLTRGPVERRGGVGADALEVVARCADRAIETQCEDRHAAGRRVGCGRRADAAIARGLRDGGTAAGRSNSSGWIPCSAGMSRASIRSCGSRTCPH